MKGVVESSAAVGKAKEQTEEGGDFVVSRKLKDLMPIITCDGGLREEG